MKKIIIILSYVLLLQLGLSAQDTIYLNGTTRVNFALGRPVVFYFTNCSTRQTPSTTVRSVSGLGSIQLKTDGSGYIIPVANLNQTLKYYSNGNCGFIERTITFKPQTIIPPPPIDTTGEGGGGGSSTPQKIMAIGDSNTEGFGLWGSYRLFLDSLLGTNYDFIGRKAAGNFSDNEHEGYSGQDIGWITNDVVRFGGVFTNNKPNTIILMIGTNDVNGENGISPNNDPIATAPNRVDELITEILARMPNVNILVVSILPIYQQPSNQGNVTKCVTFNTGVASFVAARRAAGQRVYFADVFNKFTSADLPDGLHLSVAGCRKLGIEIGIIMQALGL